MDHNGAVKALVNVNNDTVSAAASHATAGQGHTDAAVIQGAGRNSSEIAK